MSHALRESAGTRSGGFDTRRIAARAAVMVVVTIAAFAAVLSLTGIPALSLCQRFTPGALAMGVLGGAGFISLKSFSMSKAASATDIRLSPMAALRLFTQGVAIELVTWPGKAWADGFRTMRLRKVAGISLGRAAASR